MRIFDAHFGGGDALDAPGVGAEQEDVAGHALDGPVFADRAHDGVVGLGDDAVVGHLGDGAAVEDRGHAGAATAAQHVIDAVVVQERRRATGTFADALRQHLDDVIEVVAVEVAEGPGATGEVVEAVFGPVLAGALGDNLLREDVERGDGLDDAVEAAGAHGADQGGALDELVAAGGEEAALRLEAEGVTGAADALQEGRDAARRADLADEVDAADVDAELQGGGADQRLELALLEALLDAQTPVAGEAAVVAGDRVLAETLAQVVGDAFGEAARVDEDEGRAVGADQPGETLVDVGPLLASGDGLEVGGRHFEVQLEVALVAEVDDGAIGVRQRLVRQGAGDGYRSAGVRATSPPGPLSLRGEGEAIAGDVLGADEEGGDLFDGALRGAEADAGGPLLADVVEAGEGEREVAATLVAREGVNLVDDDGADVAQGLAGAGGGEHEVERLRRRDHDVRRRLDVGLAVLLRRVAGAQADPNLGPPPHHATTGNRELGTWNKTGRGDLSPLPPLLARRGGVQLGEVAKFGGDLGELLQGGFEVALDVVAERLEGRDVDDTGLVGEVAGFGLLDEGVDAAEEGRERLAGAGGRGDEDVAAGLDEGPAGSLGVGGGIEAAPEPLGDDGVEGGGWGGTRS